MCVQKTPEGSEVVVVGTPKTEVGEETEMMRVRGREIWVVSVCERERESEREVR